MMEKAICNIMLEMFSNPVCFSLMESYTKSIRDYMDAKHIEIVTERCKKLGIEFDIEKEKANPSRLFYIEIDKDELSYYYKDGSENGLRIVTFKTTTVMHPFKDNEVNVTAETNYY